MNTLQHTLSDLRVQIITLQQLTEDDGQRLEEQPPEVLASLQRTLEELQTIAATLREVQHATSNGSARGRGESSSEARTPTLLRRVGRSSGHRFEAQNLELYQGRLRALMATLLVAEESERRRLADDLHDGLSQTIALTRIKFAALRRVVDAQLKPALDEIEELIQEADRGTRAISFELSPLVLHDLGLEPAVHWLVENIHSRYGVEIVLEDDGVSKPTDEPTRLILFRSIRELLINAAKHAGAQLVHVRLRRLEGQLSALVVDDGSGMEPAAALDEGSGLFSIQERLAHVGGSLRIRSSPDRGTKIRLRAPLCESNAVRARLEA